MNALNKAKAAALNHHKDTGHVVCVYQDYAGNYPYYDPDDLLGVYAAFCHTCDDSMGELFKSRTIITEQAEYRLINDAWQAVGE